MALKLPGWLAIAYGVLTALLGIAILVWPGPTILVAVAFLAAQFVVSGAVNIGLALSKHLISGGDRALLGILGALSCLVALLVLRRPLQTVVIVTLLIGATWVVRGIVEMVTAIPGGRPHRGWSFAFGLISLIAGVVVLLNPEISLATFVWISGIWMLMQGIVIVVVATMRARAAK